MVNIVLKVGVVCLLCYVTFSASTDGGCGEGDMPKEIVNFTNCCPMVNRIDEFELGLKTDRCLNYTGDECALTKCILKQYDFGLNETSMIVKEKYIAFVKSRKSEENAKLLTEGIDDCFTNSTDANVCKVIEVSDCITNRTVQNCLSSNLWNKNKTNECKIIKKYLEKCGV